MATPAVAAREISPLFWNALFFFVSLEFKDETLITCTTKYWSIKRSLRKYIYQQEAETSQHGKEEPQQQSLLVWVWLIVKEGTSMPTQLLGLKEENQCLPCKQSMLIYESSHTTDCIAEAQLKIGCEFRVFMLANFSPIWINLDSQICWFTKLEELH